MSTRIRWNNLAEALRPVVEAVGAIVRSWWRSLPPYTRAWLRRRVRYGERPVTGPPRPALLAARVNVPLARVCYTQI